jgi:hypothetical protein
MRSWARQVHPLAVVDCPCGKIRFVHSQDGMEHIFSFATGEMGDNVLAWFDLDAPYVFKDGEYGWVKSVVRSIYKKAVRVVEHIGDFQQK